MKSYVKDHYFLDESIKLYYGYSFEDRFGISYENFKENYSFSFFEATFLEKTFTKITESDYISFSLINNLGV